MHKKTLYCIIVFIVIYIFSLSSIPVIAKNNASFYGDGIDITWEEVRPYLSVIYKNTPTISISNGKTTKQFDFNIELFWDLGLYVYGEPSSVSFTGVTNDFKKADYGYFISPNNNQKGEYRYLGYSIYGVPVTNARLPNDLSPIPYDNMTLIKYSELPDHLKKSYNIYGIDNTLYEPLRNIIENPSSPVWNFTNFTNGKEITLKQTLTNIGLFKNEKPLVSILDYGIVYNWNDSGGVIRLFYCAKNDRNIIRYATFTGPVHLELNSMLPTLTSKLSIINTSSSGNGNMFYSNTKSGTIYADINIDAIMIDNLNNLSYFQKLYSYTRNDIEEFNLYIEGFRITPSLSTSNNRELSKSGLLKDFTLNYSNLKTGINEFTLTGTAQVKINTTTIEAPCKTSIFIIYIEEIPLPPLQSPTPTPSNNHVSTPEPSGTPIHETPAPSIIPKPYHTPKITIRRRW